MDASERRKRAAAEAAEWWVLLQDDVSRTQRQRYVEWLRESAVHVAEMLRIAQVHRAVSDFERWALVSTQPSGSCANEHVVVKFTAKGGANAIVPYGLPKQRRATPGVLSSLAAALLIVIIAALGGWLSTRGQVIETDRGERREVALADGSVVQVDPETRLRVKYQAHVRRVFLDRGRALFHVARSRNRPFMVDADETTVRAVGTAFAVERGARSIVVTVAEGQVAVSATNLPTSARRADRREVSGTHAMTDSRVELLGANEQVTVDRSGTVQPVRTVDSSQALAWADGKLIFKQAPVSEVIRQFNRYNRIQLTVTDPALGGQPINGVFNAADPDSFVAFLQTVAAVKVTRDDAGNVVIEALQ